VEMGLHPFPPYETTLVPQHLGVPLNLWERSFDREAFAVTRSAISRSNDRSHKKHTFYDRLIACCAAVTAGYPAGWL